MNPHMTTNTKRYGPNTVNTTSEIALTIIQRLKDMKAMQRDPNASDKARRAERKADEKSGLITIKPLKLDGAGKGGFKKGGFKSAFGPPPNAIREAPKEAAGFKKVLGGLETEKSADAPVDDRSDDDDLGYEYYDPRKPTGCSGNCGASIG